MGTEHRWRFFRAGGVDQVALATGDDLASLRQLDQKLWVALAMPTQGVAVDERTLALLDTDRDGRVRAGELLAALEWTAARLGSLDLLLKPGDSLPLESLREEALRTAALRALSSLARPEEAGAVPPPAGAPPSEIALAQASEVLRRFAERPSNGDGVVTLEAAPDEETRAALADILATVGGETDLGGEPGVTQAKLDAFLAAARAHLEWADRPRERAELLPLGEATAEAAAAVRELREKVDDYFLRCRLAAFDERVAEAVAPALAALEGKLLSAAAPELRAMPLARVAPGRALPLLGEVNPAWSAELARLAARAVQPLLGGAPRGELDEASWEALRARLAPFEEWHAAKPASPVEGLGAERLRAVCGGAIPERLARLITDDLQLSAEKEQLAALEKLLLFRRDLATVTQNFVSFSRFYGRAPEGAVFQAGTLYIDGRACRLCLEVADSAKHGLLAALASTCLLYCDCTRAEGQKKTIVAAVTAGDSDRLMVGRNGVFYDRQGRDWDATITRIISHPISVREAFWAPYKRFARMIEEQVAKRAAAADQDAHAQMSAAAQTLASADKPKAGAPPAAPKKIDVGTVAAIGVAVGGIGAMVTGLLAAFFGLGLWMPLGFLALMLMISGPSMLLAYLKLRQRNLGPILDANGWAINGRARINVPFGAALTEQAALPAGAARTLRDPFAEKKRPWKLYLVLLVLLGLAGSWALGTLDRWLPDRVKAARVLHRTPAAPADKK